MDPTVTFLTGASSGMGHAMAPLFAADGDALALVARRAPLLETLAAEIREAGGRALAIPCDVRDREAVHAAVRRAEAELGPVGRLIANAGEGGYQAASAFDASQLELFLDTNVLGTAYCIEAVLPGMIERGSGQLVATSSLGGYRGFPGTANYSASKAALIALMESLRVELEPLGVAVTILCPGFVKSRGEHEGEHALPFMLDTEAAARRMHHAVVHRRRHYGFPAPMAFAAWFGKALPAPLYDRLISRATPKEVT